MRSLLESKKLPTATSPHSLLTQAAVRSAEREHGPKGAVQAFDARSGGVAAQSSVYPGTLHRWWLYVPAGYDELDSTADCNLTASAPTRSLSAKVQTSRPIPPPSATRRARSSTR